MKRLLFLFFILLINNTILADEIVKKVVCGFGECRPDFTPNIYLEKSTATFLDVGDFNTDTIEVTLPVNQEPRSLFFTVNNNDAVGQDLFVDFQSKRSGYNTEDFILVGDIFDNVNIKMDGYQGIDGKDASSICAERVLSGMYGDFFKTQFLDRREADPRLPADKCVEEDVDEIQRNAFQCLSQTGDAQYEEEDFSLVNVERVKFKQRCIGTSVKYKCVKRKVRVECRWKSLPYGYPGPGLPCNNRWGGNNCAYDLATSCWRSRDLNNIYAGTSSYPSQNAVNPWEVVFDTNSCSFPGEDSPTSFSETTGMNGGAFAYNLTNQMLEKQYKDAEREGRLAQFCAQNSAGPPAPGWIFDGIEEVTYEQPGLDLDTLEPLPGSTWEVESTGFFEECSIFGDFEVLTPILENWQTYGEIGNECNDVSIAEDPNNLIPWTKSGVAQDRSFGTELLLCSPDNCQIETIARKEEAIFDEIQPTPGTSGTNQGDAILFVYDIDNLSATARTGLGGDGGDNDLPALNNEKYCTKILDANTQGINSEFALKPIVYFNEYDWRAIKVGPGRPGGEDAPFSTKGIKLYKKIDSSVRHLLKNDNF